MPQRLLCRQFKIGQHYLEDLIDRFDKYGFNGLQRKSNNKLTGEEKKILVRQFIEIGVPLRCIINTYDVSRNALESWIRTVRSNGYDSPYNQKQRGLPPKDTMERPNEKEPQTELEKLQAENLRFRAENALLKKVKTLAEEQKAQARSNGQKPSTN